MNDLRALVGHAVIKWQFIPTFKSGGLFQLSNK